MKKIASLFLLFATLVMLGSCSGLDTADLCSGPWYTEVEDEVTMCAKFTEDDNVTISAIAGDVATINFRGTYSISGKTIYLDIDRDCKVEFTPAFKQILNAAGYEGRLEDAEKEMLDEIDPEEMAGISEMEVTELTATTMKVKEDGKELVFRHKK